MATYGEDPTLGRAVIQNIQPIKALLTWLTETEYQNYDQQVWLTEALHNLCVASLKSLGQHSLSSSEMKILIKLLQNKPEDGLYPDNTTEFPYKSHVIHIISSIAKGDGFEHCKHYFDIQESTDGVTVPSIREWPGPVQGFTFHAWIRLDPMRTVSGTNGQIRRQLYSFYTNSEVGLEAFFVPDGSLVVATAYKKTFSPPK